jgi:glycosyltransferase involved in cell wall biosynthesis
MKIAYIIPGSGGSFYCGNCIRDINLIRALKKQGLDITIVPMYLPLISDDSGIQADTPVFYGAINIFLKQKVPLFRLAPGWIERMVDSPLILGFAARKAGSTRASGLSDITLSMLRGEKGMQWKELDKLLRKLQQDIKPEVVHLSNALLLGLVKRVKQELEVGVVCSLQDEDTWISSMNKTDAEAAWRLLRYRSRYVDVFVSVSKYYAGFMEDQLRVQKNRIRVVPAGINLEGYEPVHPFPIPPVIGFLSRMSESSGLGLLIEAFLKLKNSKDMNGIRLHIMGGRTGDDKKFIKHLLKKLKSRDVLRDVQFFQTFDRNARIKFFRSLSVLSVPVIRGGAFGIFLLEALASGIPVVQPKVGAFPEIVRATGGGILYDPGDVNAHVRALSLLLNNPERASEIGLQGRKSVEKEFSIENISKRMIDIYRRCTVSHL